MAKTAAAAAAAKEAARPTASVTEPFVIIRSMTARQCAEFVRWFGSRGEESFQQWLIDQRQATLDELPGVDKITESFATLESLDLETRVHMFLVDMAEGS